MEVIVWRNCVPGKKFIVWFMMLLPKNKFRVQSKEFRSFHKPFLAHYFYVKQCAIRGLPTSDMDGTRTIVINAIVKAPLPAEVQPGHEPRSIQLKATLVSASVL